MNMSSHLQRSAEEGTIDLFSLTHFLYLNGNIDTYKQISPETSGMWAYVWYLNQSKIKIYTIKVRNMRD